MAPVGPYMQPTAIDGVMVWLYLMLELMQMPVSPFSTTSYENLWGKLSTSKAVHAPGSRLIELSVFASSAATDETRPTRTRSAPTARVKAMTALHLLEAPLDDLSRLCSNVYVLYEVCGPFDVLGRIVRCITIWAGNNRSESYNMRMLLEAAMLDTPENSKSLL